MQRPSTRIRKLMERKNPDTAAKMKEYENKCKRSRALLPSESVSSVQTANIKRTVAPVLSQGLHVQSERSSRVVNSSERFRFSHVQKASEARKPRSGGVHFPPVRTPEIPAILRPLFLQPAGHGSGSLSGSQLDDEEDSAGAGTCVFCEDEFGSCERCGSDYCGCDGVDDCRGCDGSFCAGCMAEGFCRTCYSVSGVRARIMHGLGAMFSAWGDDSDEDCSDEDDDVEACICGSEAIECTDCHSCIYCCACDLDEDEDPTGRATGQSRCKCNICDRQSTTTTACSACPNRICAECPIESCQKCSKHNHCGLCDGVFCDHCMNSTGATVCSSCCPGHSSHPPSAAAVGARVEEARPHQPEAEVASAKAQEHADIGATRPRKPADTKTPPKGLGEAAEIIASTEDEDEEPPPEVRRGRKRRAPAGSARQVVPAPKRPARNQGQDPNSNSNSTPPAGLGHQPGMQHRSQPGMQYPPGMPFPPGMAWGMEAGCMPPPGMMYPPGQRPGTETRVPQPTLTESPRTVNEVSRRVSIAPLVLKWRCGGTQGVCRSTQPTLQACQGP